ncbi:50S ribosomal protein L30 [SAR86 cluster bacterium]|jgi:large subunit ribosomal protein L30|nr:50S ribosomal protein L30 [Gammaproteobacteria bacterium]MDC3152896.1 50S ribosomal protein L30 [SAR86 cluster bacterium]OUX43279.1 MAG: 50S ribosomal protein L30 [Gammaproteobacteria bacterium TMED278]RCL36732.1 MAG: 50S ribosomal protein L30 [SAR86 cluster bacterium]URQ69774.1 50S ribosomal protein L30 [SAR86 cluster bacterium]|tara:strand:+ start:109 stop:297 length:189 start_codon:yes stop_codon:yes gene_type:complete
MNKSKLLKIKLIKSGIGRMNKHKLCIKGLGFRKLNQVVSIEDTSSNRGMVNKIRDMIEILDN